MVYCFAFPCGLFYVGRTIRTLRNIFKSTDISQKKGHDEHSVPRHFLEYHNKSAAGLQVWAIESIPQLIPVAERFKHLCQQESHWIYSLGTLSPEGFIEELEVYTLL